MVMSPYLLGFGCQLLCNTAPNNVWDYGYKPHLLKAINSTKDSNGIARNALLPLSAGIDEKYDVIGGCIQIIDYPCKQVNNGSFGTIPYSEC
jgi:hypothetical protein